MIYVFCLSNIQFHQVRYKCMGNIIFTKTELLDFIFVELGELDIGH